MSGINELSLRFLVEYLLYFFAIYVFALLLDVFGVFDKAVSFYAQKSFKNLSEAIHRSRSKRDYAKYLTEDRYQRLPFFQKLCRCFVPEKYRESELDIEELEKEWVRWQHYKKLHANDFKNRKKNCCNYAKENVSEYYFTELLDISYLGTHPFKRFAKQDVISVFGLFNIHFSKGFLSDFLYYIMNNHSFLSMFMAIRGHPFNRNARRLTYLSANCVTFFFAIIATHMNSSGSTAFSILVISPLVIAVRKWMFNLLACPCYRTVLEREERNCAYYGYACLGSTGKCIAYFCVFCFVAVLFPAALLTPTDSATEGKSAVIAYAQSVTLVSFGQEFIYSLLVFWTGEASVTIKLCGFVALGYGGYFKDKVHILGLRGLRLQQLKLTYMQEQLEKRQQRSVDRSVSKDHSSAMTASRLNSSATDDSNYHQHDTSVDHYKPGVDLDESHLYENTGTGDENGGTDKERLSSPSFRPSVRMQDVNPSVLHRYDYAIQEMEWVRYLTCSMVEIEFFVSIPFVREFTRELHDEYADMPDDNEDEDENLAGHELDQIESQSVVSTTTGKEGDNIKRETIESPIHQ